MKIQFPFLTFCILLCFIGCDSEQGKSPSLSHIKDTKTKQYAVEGKNLYEKNCANCHQTDGSGLGRVIPPLAHSDYMKDDISRTVKIIKHGLRGEITVNGVVYNQNMPSNPHLTNMEIAQITTYIYNIWGDHTGVIDANQVADFLKD
ncbi:c-type cytochrome [Anditalea andensis]|uniref:Cytochrome C n=1 Tax=Anditalea andensis TaxID=1048983 RepID=A0A074L3I9_9BACT|nr:cytochrome c [Anditalea andensis]KEO74423.1 cytochrome C [Anditalea andensis]